MNMNTTRLDDKLNSVLIGAAVAIVMALGLDVSGGASLGRLDRAAGPAMAMVSPAAMVVAVAAVR